MSSLRGIRELQDCYEPAAADFCFSCLHKDEYLSSPKCPCVYCTHLSAKSRVQREEWEQADIALGIKEML